MNIIAGVADICTAIKTTHIQGITVLNAVISATAKAV